MHLKIKKITVAVLMLSAAVSVHAQIYKVALSGSNEIPAVTPGGSGTAVVVLNSTTHEMRVSANFTGLVGNSTASHIHCCAVQPANAGVATTTPAFVGFPIGVTAGAWDNTYNMTLPGTWNAAFITANGGTPANAETAFISGVAAGRSYLNIHSAISPGGELRGNLVPHSFVASASMRSNSIAAALDSLGTGTGAVTDRLVGMAMLTSAGEKSAMELLLPSSAFAVQTVTSNTLLTAFDQMGSRLQGLRISAAGTTAAENGLWVNGVSIANKQDTTSGYAGFDANGWGFAMGYDQQMAPGLLLGASISMAEHSMNFKDQLAGSNTSISNQQLSLYGSKEIGKGYVEAMVSFGGNNIDFLRNAGLAGYARAQANSDQWAARIGGGYNVALTTAITMTPQVRIDWGSLNLGSYQEFGAGGLALNVNSQSLDRAHSSIGAQFDWNGGVGFAPFLRGLWNHECKDGGSNQMAAFVNGGNSFVDIGQKVDTNAYSLGVGINFHGKSGMSASIAYDMVSSTNYQADIFLAKLFWAF